MGNSASLPPFPYACPVTEVPPLPGRSRIYRASSHYNELVEGFKLDRLDTALDVFRRGEKISTGGPCLGQRRKYVDTVSGAVTFGEVEWLTYSEVFDRATWVGSGILNMGLITLQVYAEEQYEAGREMRILGVCARNRLEWFFVEQACNQFSVCLVPLYDTLGDDAVVFIIEKTRLECICVSDESCAKLLGVLNKFPGSCPSLKTLVVFDCPISQSLYEAAAPLHVELIEFEEVLRSGSQNPRQLVEPNRKTVATICFTSGTTGTPKGAILTQGAFAANVSGAIRGPLATAQFHLGKDDLHISYLPLAHVFERIICYLVWCMGGSACVYSGDTQKLLDDIKVVRPTVFISVPRLYMRINDKINAGLAEKSALAQYLFRTGMNTKINKLRRRADPHDRIWDALVFNQTKALLGGRVRYLLTGSAPLESLIQEKMSVLFNAKMLEGYGLTETLGATFISVPADPVAGHIGGVLPCNEFVLQDVPDMNYFVTDDPPAGELLIRGHTVIPGYFLAPQETKDAFTEDGFLKTGDIVVLLPGGALKIVDRKKNIFKLSQGEYVAPERIENILSQADLVAQIFVYGESEKSFLVGIVVPDEEAAAKWQKTVRPDLAKLSFEDLVKEAAFHDAVLNSLQRQEEASGLKGFEKVKAIHLISEQFTPENELLTPTYKLKRHQAKLLFKQEIDWMYSNGVTPGFDKKNI